MNSMKITKRHARKVLEVVNHGLVKGMGTPEPGKMCVEAAVCFALGLPHSDDPKCVSPAVRAFKIALNDLDWPSDEDRAKGMAKLAIAQLGSDGIDDVVFAKELARLTIQKIVPIALREAAKAQKEPHKQAMLDAADKCEKEGTRDAASNAANAANAASNAAYAASYAAYAAYAKNMKLKIFRIAADIGIAALEVAGAVGCKWLDLAE